MNTRTQHIEAHEQSVRMAIWREQIKEANRIAAMHDDLTAWERHNHANNRRMNAAVACQETVKFLSEGEE